MKLGTLGFRLKRENIGFLRKRGKEAGLRGMAQKGEWTRA